MESISESLLQPKEDAVKLVEKDSGEIVHSQAMKSTVPNETEEIHSALSSSSGKKCVFYPGDLICYRAKKPYEWTVWYGKVLSIDNPLVVNYIGQEQQWEDKTDKTIPEDQNENGQVGTDSDVVYIQWNHSNRIGKTHPNEIGLVDRELTSGQRVQTATGIQGTVIGTSAKVALQIHGTNYVIENVDTEKLNPVSPLIRGREILYHGWVGVITTISRSVRSQFDTGTIFDLESYEADGFMRTDPYWGQSTPCPGTRTTLSRNILKKAKFQSKFFNFLNHWIPPFKAYYASLPCTTIAVESFGIQVKWLQKCETSVAAQNSEPEQLIQKEKFKEIRLLGIPSVRTVGINSVRMYLVQPSDSVITYAAWFNSFQARMLSGSDSPSSSKFYPSLVQRGFVEASKGLEIPVLVVCKETYANVELDNGEIEQLKSTDLAVVSQDENDDLPIGLIVENVLLEKGKYGVIQPSERMGLTKLVKVRWILPSSETGNDTIDLGVKNESIYDLKPHDNYSLYQKGTILFLNEDPLHYDVGTVMDLDICHGKLILAVPNLPHTISVWPHSVTPMKSKYCWDFFSRKWTIDSLIPLLHRKFIEDGVGIPKRDTVPVSLNTNNNNSSRIWDEPTFEILDAVPDTHRYFLYELKNPRDDLLVLLRSEAMELKKNLPDGIWIRGYDSRMDLYSALILGPEKTPYEDQLYFFDIHIPMDFPAKPPKVHYVPYADQTISPLIANDGTFCISKLIWDFSDGKPESYIANMLSQIQELVFISEPYFQFPDQEKLIGTLEGKQKSRSFNEQVFLGGLTGSLNMAMRPYEPWRRIIGEHLSNVLPEKMELATQWIRFTNLKDETDDDEFDLPETSFNILPISEGFKVAVSGRIEKLQGIFSTQSQSILEEALPIARISNANIINDNEEPLCSDKIKEGYVPEDENTNDETEVKLVESE